jgi:hypothetical protein
VGVVGIFTLCLGLRAQRCSKRLAARTLASGDLADLQKWFADNGYAIRPAASDALNPYVHDGWSFVAMRLTSSAPMWAGLIR